MSLYRPKKSPFWHYDFQLRGRRFHGSTGTASKIDAREVEAAEREKARRQLLLGEAPARETMTVNRAFGRYYIEVSQHRRTESDDRRAMARLIDMLGADRLLAEITDSDIATLVSRRRAMTARNKETLVSAATVNRDVELLRRVWRRAAAVWKVDVGEMPAWSNHLLAEPKERVRELRADDEEERLWKAVRDLRPDFEPLLYVAMRVGVRLSGLIGLTWSDVDLRSGTISYTLKGSRGAPARRVTKRMPSDVVETIRQQRGQHAIFVFTYVCQKHRGQRRKGERYPFSANGWRKAWASILETAGLKDFRFHDLRHTAGSRIVRQGGNLKLAQRLLDHTSLAATTRYVHVTDDDLVDALERSRKTPGRNECEGGNELKDKKNSA